MNIIFPFIEERVIFYCSFRFVSERMLPLQRNELYVYCKLIISFMITYFYKLTVGMIIGIAF